MSIYRDAAGREWERVEDDDEDGASSSTTVLPEDLQGGERQATPVRQPGSEAVPFWTPSVQGAVSVPRTDSSRLQMQRQLNWDVPETHPQQSEDRGWQWSWSSWSSSTSSTWDWDPWSHFLDSHRPGWRRRGNENWSVDGESNWSRDSPEDDEVPLPRLLSRRENSPPAKDETAPVRAQWEEARHGDAGRAPRNDSPRAHSRALLPVRLGAEVRAAGPAPTTLETRAHRNDSPQGEPRAPGNGEVLARRHEGGGPLEEGKPGEASHGPKADSGNFLKLHNSFPPEFKARAGESWKDYWRSVEFWLASEGVNLPASVRGSRLMQQMKERAAKILNHLSVADVATDGGVMLIKAEMEKSPIIRLLEHKEVDQKRQKFMKLARHPRESLESFINRASIYRHENDQCQNYRVGTKFYLGHLLDAAKLTKKDMALVKTASQGLHDEQKVVSAILELSEQLEGLPGYPIGRGEPGMPDEDQYLVQKRDMESYARPRPDDRHSGRTGHEKGSRGHRFRKKWRQVFHTILEDAPSSDSEHSDQPTGTEEATEAGDGVEEDETFHEEAETAGNLPAEVYAQEYKAKKKVNEIKQMRQFYNKNPERTKAWIKEQQKKELCFLCNKLQHWSQECPLRRHQKDRTRPSASHAVHVTSSGATTGPEQWSLLETLSAYTGTGVGREALQPRDCLVAHGVQPQDPLSYETFWSMRELHSSLILDLGCMKSVAGTKWVNQHIQRLKGLGRWMKSLRETESFRFGDGHELCSEFAFLFEATILGVRVILKLSVVPGECPPLLSKQACSQLGMVIDTENHTVSSRKLQVKRYGLAQTCGGHYAIPIAEFTDDMKHIHEPEFPSYLEAIPVYVTCDRPRERVLSDEGGLKSWTRHDRDLQYTVGDKLLEEFVNRSTPVRQQLQWRTDTALMNLRRKPSPARAAPYQATSDKDDEFTEAMRQGYSSDSWEKVDEPSESEEKEKPESRSMRPRQTFRERFSKARSKSSETRSKSSERRMKPKSALKTVLARSPTPRTKRSTTPARGSQAPPTPASVASVASRNENMKMLQAQAAELEEMLTQYMDPASIVTEGSKATKAYWVARVAVLEGDYEEIPKAKNKKPSEKLDLLLEDAPPNPRGRASTTTSTGARPKTKTQRVRALTDLDADFPTLSNRYSDDVVINAALSLTCQMLTFKWKQFTWMLRVKRAVKMELGGSVRWRRNPRWLMMMFGRQLASMWGHLGAARQLCNDPRLNDLMKGDPIARREEDRSRRED
ncbi:hypothetical protein AK812_SmicGene22229 [Symbiodinium microadriaticum]|uniref:CCHC-type domain-containing protein n=1 Tax=Symbiodinium microadriaticum TaxID=2951 RepID=A0A1Q9DKE0_SYMMI|nr:hypothetical protein AK812_SmicGene22229 [Symbiodinium microadriaticum]